MDREDLAIALKQAMRSHKLTAIARECGVPAQSLQQFNSTGSMGQEKCDKLQDWLKSHGYDTDKTGGIRHVMAEEMRLVISVLENGTISGAAAVERLRDLFKIYRRELASLEDDIKEQ